ncbi:MAG: pyruvate ferredoxin oxidoreductase [bacterium]|nr:pyruvate ferredoxin oxidoreductase [bacterium]
MPITEIRVAGFGGQGVILAAMIIGKAASIFEDGYATLTQSFGPEARGSACSAQVILSKEPILYPYLTQPDVMIAMSQDACAKFSPELKSGGTLLVEEDLVRICTLPPGAKLAGVPATRLAEEIGKRLVLNIVMTGFFGAVTKLISPDALRKAVADSVPPGTEDMNLRAFDRGFEYGLSELRSELPEAQPIERGIEGIFT